MAPKTAGQMIQEMPGAFRPERAARASAVIQFQISGEGGGDWYVTIKNKTCTLTEGIADKPNATVSMSNDDYVALGTGEMSTMKAFTSRRIKTSGDLSLLKRMERWFVRS